VMSPCQILNFSHINSRPNFLYLINNIYLITPIHIIYNIDNIDNMNSMRSDETEQMEEKWQKEFYKLEDDFDLFRDYFNKIKKCDCNIDECKHFDAALTKVLGKKVDDLWDSRLQIGFRTYKESIEPVLKKEKKS